MPVVDPSVFMGMLEDIAGNRLPVHEKRRRAREYAKRASGIGNQNAKLVAQELSHSEDPNLTAKDIWNRVGWAFDTGKEIAVEQIREELLDEFPEEEAEVRDQGGG